MKNIFLSFVFLFSCLQADEHLEDTFEALPKSEGQDISQLEIVLSAECEPITTVAGCVNAISGHFFQVEPDLNAATIDPLVINRHYDSGSEAESFLGTGFGSQYPLLASDIQKGAGHSYALISQKDGFLIASEQLVSPF